MTLTTVPEISYPSCCLILASHLALYPKGSPNQISYRACLPASALHSIVYLYPSTCMNANDRLHSYTFQSSSCQLLTSNFARFTTCDRLTINPGVVRGTCSICVAVFELNFECGGSCQIHRSQFWSPLLSNIQDGG